MKFKNEDFQQHGDRIRDVGRDPEVAGALKRLRHVIFERDLLERKEEAYLNTLAVADDLDADAAMAALSGWRRRRWDLSREALVEYLKARQRVDADFRRMLVRQWPRAALMGAIARLKENELVGCVPVERASGLQFLHSWCVDDCSGVTLAGIGFDFGGGGITSLRYEVDLYGSAFLTLEASWGLVVPNANLCGLEISGTTSVGGFVDNKATHTVTIDPEVHVRQYRSNKPLDEVDLGGEPLVTNIRGTITAGGVEYSPPGYIDGTYGLHGLPSISSELRCAYAYPGHTAFVSVQPGDRLVVSCQIILAVDTYSYVLLGDPRPSATPPYFGGVVFSQPSVTFYADA
jgi:hypothetical protein